MALQGSGGTAALLVLSIMLSLLACSVLATSYTVGDSSGWAQGVNYNSWAAGKTFQKGDTLVFNYSPPHSVLQVSESDYNTCTPNNHLREIQSGSSFTLQDDVYYFICGIPHHCFPNGGAGGENLAVKVSSSSGDGSSGGGSPGGGSSGGGSSGGGSGCASGCTTTTPSPPPPSTASGLQASTTLAVASMAFIPFLL